eukprot:TRINITY_DN1749_c0_g1_i1.p1 TRINITY_DN1749_c0_g1~~TRINITY_DN1749_c0_g1_i1.p1  ORF type:complete len:351 (-),score=72.45 TRINITY_DN1749_c0_g1_i1:138-1190(-)
MNMDSEQDGFSYLLNGEIDQLGPLTSSLERSMALDTLGIEDLLEQRDKKSDSILDFDQTVTEDFPFLSTSQENNNMETKPSLPSFEVKQEPQAEPALAPTIPAALPSTSYINTASLLSQLQLSNLVAPNLSFAQLFPGSATSIGFHPQSLLSSLPSLYSPSSSSSSSSPSYFAKHEDGSEKSSKRVKTEHTMSGVHLSKKQLHTLSSEEYEDLVKLVRCQRALTEQEVAVYKENKRLIRNREAAQNSRTKKKTLIEQLEHQIEKTREENFQMEKDMEKLSAANQSIREELHFLMTLISQSSALSSAFSAYQEKSKKEETVPVQSETCSRAETSSRTFELKREDSAPIRAA